MSHSASHIAHIRTDYSLAALDETVTGTDPMAFFSRWFAEAHEAQISEVNAMTLATADEQGRPHARIVLLKGIEDGGFSFYTNYLSAKGRQMEDHHHVALVFFWKELERQVRIEGIARKLDAAVSDAYFRSRPHGSQLGAWSSPQSQPIAHRQILDDNYQSAANKFEGKDIPRPEHWGGYVVAPESIEFWQGRSSRMHDRIHFQLTPTGLWSRQRLAP